MLNITMIYGNPTNDGSFMRSIAYLLKALKGEYGGMNKKWLVLAAFMLGYVIPLYAAEETSLGKQLTFSDFYRKVLVYYPKLKQQDANVNLAIARKLQAVSGFLPQIQGVTSVTRGDDPVFVFGSLLHESAFTPDDFVLSRLNTPRSHTTYSVSLEAQMPIFDAFQTIFRVRSSKLQIDSARDEASFTKMEAFLVASEAYLRAVAVTKMLATVNEVSLASQEDIKQAEDLKDKGLILGADYYAAKVMYGSIIQLKNQLAQEKQAAYILLNILMGENPFNHFEVQGNLAEEPRGGKQLQSWFDEAYASRPDYAALDKIIQAQRIELSREKSTALPRLDVFGEARDDTHDFKSNGGQNYIVGLKARIDLFDPSYSSRVRGKNEALKKLEFGKAVLKDTITKDVANEYAHYQTAEDNLPVNRKMLEDARQAVDLMLLLYREGRKSIADLLQIRLSYLSSARGYYTLVTDTRASWTRLLFLSGQLDESRMKGVVTSIGE
jgi:outer membrane protein TolC